MVGITEAEYRRVRERNLPCFIYFKDEASIPQEERESDPEKITRLAFFKEELLRNHTITPPFSTPDGLATGVAADLHNWLFDYYLPQLLSGISTDYAARSIEPDSSRARVLTMLLLHLTEPLQGFVLNEALQTARKLEFDSQRSAALTLLCPYLTRLSPVKLYLLWSQLLHFLARRTRSALVADLRTLRPVIEVLGGPSAIAETAREIHEIGDWW